MIKWLCSLKGIGPKCPNALDPLRNALTGRVIEDPEVIDRILELHNEVRSKIARGWCDQPKAGCMGPLVKRTLRLWAF